MYICNLCGATFETPDIIKQHHPYGMGLVAEELIVCPICEGTDYSEAKQCERYGELVAELESGLCEVCHGDMYGE